MMPNDEDQYRYVKMRMKQKPYRPKADPRPRIVLATWFLVDLLPELDRAMMNAGAKNRAAFLRELIEREIAALPPAPRARGTRKRDST